MTPEQDDFMNKRFESFIKVIHGLLNDFTEKHVQAIDEKIDKKFNGKMEKMLVENKLFREENQDMYASLKIAIDSMDMKINKLSLDATPMIEDRKTITNVGRFIIWVGGITAAIIGVYKLFRL